MQNLFDVGKTTIRKYFGKYILQLLKNIPDNIHLPPATVNKLDNMKIKFEHSAEGTLGIRDAKFVILVIYVGPILYDLICSGCTLEETLVMLRERGVTFIESRVGEASRRNSMNERVCKRIWGMNYQECRREFFINPLFERLKEQGIDFIIGEGMEKIDQIEIQDLLDRRFEEKFIIGEGTEELGLIERLALSGLSGWAEITSALGVTDSLTPQGTRRRASASIANYVRNRWGTQYGNYNAFVEFLRTHFLGRGTD